MTSLEERLNEVVSRQKIIEHLHSYCRSADRLDPAGMLEHFTDDCEITYVVGLPPMKGKPELHAMLTEYLPNTSSSQHMITNHEITLVSPNEAILNTYMFSWQRFKAYPTRADTNRFGRYECRLVMKAEGWRFTHMILIVAGEYGETRIGEHFGRTFPAKFDHAK